jgi:hypothetical protein
MPTLYSIDQAVFIAINHLPHTNIFNSLAEFFSGIGEWGAVWFIIALVLFFREERRDHWFFLPTLWALGFGVLISEFLLKNIIARSRPMVEFDPGICHGVCVVQRRAESPRVVLSSCGTYLTFADISGRPLPYGYYRRGTTGIGHRVDCAIGRKKYPSQHPKPVN